MSPTVIVQQEQQPSKQQQQQHALLERTVSLSSIHDDIIPEEFICPISLSVMKDPVVSKDGQTYDRHAILQWLAQGHTTCPLTRQPLKPSLLVPNVNLRMRLMKWKAEKGIKLDDPLDFEDKSLLKLSSLGLITLDLPMSSARRQEQRQRHHRHQRRGERRRSTTRTRRTTIKSSNRRSTLLLLISMLTMLMVI